MYQPSIKSLPVFVSLIHTETCLWHGRGGICLVLTNTGIVRAKHVGSTTKQFSRTVLTLGLFIRQFSRIRQMSLIFVRSPARNMMTTLSKKVYELKCSEICLASRA